MITDREKFSAILSTGPVLRAEAIVVLCGEDAFPRYQTALQLLKQNASDYLLLSGGLSGEGKMDAREVESALVGLGLSPQKIIVESESKNTREQAVNVVKIVKEKNWKRLILVASAYHLTRATLTFVKALQEEGLSLSVQIVPFPATAPWYGSPEGVRQPRHRLLGLEMDKIEEYEEHVASYAQGLAYIKHWEAA